jgi:hypothetical protein
MFNVECSMAHSTLNIQHSTFRIHLTNGYAVRSRRNSQFMWKRRREPFNRGEDDRQRREGDE